MGSALSSGVSGMIAHQKMLDVTGNNIANVNTSAFKASRITFSEALSQTLRDATQPVETIGGTNPMQVGGGVQVGMVARNMTGGDLESTGRALDMAIEGEGYFVMYDGQQEVYTRVGAFEVDAQNYLVDPATGYRAQRIGNEGEEDGFQVPGSNDIRIPYDMVVPAKSTENVSITGNLQSDTSSPTTQTLQSGTVFTDTNVAASGTSVISDLDQASGLGAGSQITISGWDRTGAAIADRNVAITAGVTTMQDLCDEIELAFGGNVTASISGGEIVVVDNTNGFSKLDMNLSYSAGPGSLELPGYFEIAEPGADFSRKVSIDVYDQRGGAHALSGAFVKHDVGDNWDFVLTSLEGDVTTMADRRIEDIRFLPNGAYGGLAGADTQTFDFTFANNGGNTTLQVDLGTVGKFDGITQFGEASTANASEQDGYAAGQLTALSVSRGGVIMGIFDNGIRKDIAAVRIATFQNPAGLESLGNNYFLPSSNSGVPNAQKALTGGTGAVRGSSLEKSNVDVANEFVSLIQAQNGYQANARTIRVANEILQELTQLIR